MDGQKIDDVLDDIDCFRAGPNVLDRLGLEQGKGLCCKVL